MNSIIFSEWYVSRCFWKLLSRILMQQCAWMLLCHICMWSWTLISSFFKKTSIILRNREFQRTCDWACWRWTFINMHIRTWTSSLSKVIVLFHTFVLNLIVFVVSAGKSILTFIWILRKLWVSIFNRIFLGDIVLIRCWSFMCFFSFHKVLFCTKTNSYFIHIIIMTRFFCQVLHGNLLM